MTNYKQFTKKEYQEARRRAKEEFIKEKFGEAYEEASEASYQALNEISRKAIPTKINTKKELFDAIFCINVKVLLTLPKPEVLEQIFQYIEDIFDEQEEDYREEYWIYHTKRMEKIDALKD